MKRYLILFLTLISFLTINAQEHKSYQLSLEDCIRFATANSLERKSMELNTESQQVSYEQSKQQRLPSLNASLGENFSNNRGGVSMSGNAGISSSVVIYQGGKIRNSIEQSRLNLERSQTQINQYDNQLSVQILQSFLSILGNEEMLKYQAEVLNSSREQYKQGQARYQVGSILESDLLLLQAQYLSDSNNMVNTTISRDNNLLSLKVLLSMDPTDDLQIISPNTDDLDALFASLPTEDEAIQAALETYPNLKLNQYDIQLAETNVAMAKGNFMPSINANANVGVGYNGFNNVGNQLANSLSESAGVSLSIPIYSRGSNKANLKKSQISLQQAQLDYEQNVLSTRQTIVQSYRTVVSSYNAYKVSQAKEEAYRKSFHAYELQFQYGKITTVELLQQQNNYLNTLNDYIQNKYSLVLQRKILDVYMGQSIVL